MDDNKLDFFRNELELKKSEILDEAGKTMGEMTDQTTNVPDPNDRASIEARRSFELRIRDRERKLLSKIDEALVRIDEGIFGVCQTCDEEIGIKRLEARPVTTLCIECKTAQETQEKSKGL